MQKNKIDSILGFAVKAGKVIYGFDTIERSKDRYYVIFICSTLSENTKSKVLSLALRKNVKIIVTAKELCYIVNRENCKVIALTDKQMSQAVLGMTDDNYHLISSEVK